MLSDIKKLNSTIKAKNQEKKRLNDIILQKSHDKTKIQKKILNDFAKVLSSSKLISSKGSNSKIVKEKQIEIKQLIDDLRNISKIPDQQAIINEKVDILEEKGKIIVLNDQITKINSEISKVKDLIISFKMREDLVQSKIATENMTNLVAIIQSTSKLLLKYILDTQLIEPKQGKLIEKNEQNRLLINFEFLASFIVSILTFFYFLISWACG